MLWLFPWPESIKQRLCRYLLEHYLGQYFEQKLVLQQLNIDLYNGVVTLNNINLNCNALNEQLKTLNIPFEIINGSVGSIFVYVPWHDLINDNCKLEVKNINLTIRPTSEDFLNFECNSPSASDMFSSVFLNSMQTSRIIAENCLRDENCVNDSLDGHNTVDLDENFSTTNLTGLDALTRTIDSVLARIKINTENIHIRLENILERNPNGYSNGIALEFHIKSIKYFDIDTLNTNSNLNNKKSNDKQQQQLNEQINLPAITNKKFSIDGLTVYCDEFTIKENLLFHEDTPPPPLQQQTSIINQQPTSNLMTTSIYINEDDNLNNLKLDEQLNVNYVYTNPVLCATFTGIQEIDITIKQPSISNLQAPTQPHHQSQQNTPKLEVNAQFGSIKCFLCPKQIHLLYELINGFSKVNNKNNSPNELEYLNKQAKSNDDDTSYGLHRQKPIRGYDQQKFESLIQNDLLNLCNNGINSKNEMNFITTKLSGNGIEIKIDNDNDENEDIDDDDEFQSFDDSRNQSKLETNDIYYSMLPPDNEINLNSMISNNRRKSSINEENDSLNNTMNGCMNNNKFYQNNNNNEDIDDIDLNSEDVDEKEFNNLNKKKDKLNEQIKHSTSNQTQFELFVYKIKFTMFSLTILQENPENSMNKMLGDYMKNESEIYFEQVSCINTSGVLNNKDFLDIRNKFFEACAFNDHLLLLCKPINIQFTQKLDKKYLTITDLTCSIGYMELIEYLSNTTVKPTPLIQTTSTSKNFKLNILKSATINEIIKFDSSTSALTPNEACLKLKYLSYEPTINLLNINTLDKRKIYAKVPFKSINLNLNRLVLDIDVSIIDRLYYLINPFNNSDNDSHNIITDPLIGVDDTTNANIYDDDDDFYMLNKKSKINKINNFLNSIDIKVPNLKVIIRFPIATFITPYTNLSAIQWRKRQIRDQYLLLQFNEFNFQLNYYLSDFNKLMQISCNQINGYYSSVKINDKPILFAQVNKTNDDFNDTSMIKFIIKLNDIKNPNFLKSIEKLMSESLIMMGDNENNDLNYDSLISQYSIRLGSNKNGQNIDNTGNYSPFSSANSHISGKDNYRIINPANKYEMYKFITHTKLNSEVLINLKIPKINVLICDFEFLNDLYNCFLNDLLMWEPLAPKVSNNLVNINTPFTNNAATFEKTKKTEKFELCKSAILKTDDDYLDYDDDDNDDDLQQKSTLTNKNNHNESLNSMQSLTNKYSNYHPHKLCFILSANQAKLKIYYYQPQQQNKKYLNYGEFDLTLNSFKLCVLSGHYGNINNQYMSLLTDKISLSHDNHQIDVNSKNSFFYPSLQDKFECLFNSALKPKELLGANKVATGLFEPETTQFSEIKLNNYRKIKFKIPMVSLALESKLEPNSDVTKPAKKYLKLAFNINNACLNHQFTTDDKFWLIQLIDLLNLQDIEINGYVVPIVVTELHLNVTNSSIDYRPLKLDTKALIGFKSLRMSSNVAQFSQATLLLFNVEDIYLFITNYKLQNYDLKRDYVCIANADLFEFRLLINDKPTEQGGQSTSNQKQQKNNQKSLKLKSPILDIKIRCNLIQIRTCVDSCYCLIELLSYIGADGDINAQLALNNINTNNNNNSISETLPSNKNDHKVDDNDDDDDDDDEDDEDDNIISSSPKSQNTNELLPPLTIPSPSTNIKNESNICDMVNEAMSQSVYGSLDYDDRNDNNSSNLNSRRNSDNYGSPFGNINKTNRHDGNYDDDDDDDDEDDDDKNLIEDFEFIDMIPGLGVLPSNNQEYIIKNLRKNESQIIEIEDNYFSKPITKIDVLKAPDTYPCPLYSYCVQEISIQWSLYGGHDMYHEKTLDESTSKLPPSPAPVLPSALRKSQTSEAISINPMKKTISFNTSSIANTADGSIIVSPLKPTSLDKQYPKLAGGRLSTKYDTRSLNWIQKGPLTRNLDVCMEFMFSKVKTKIDIYDSTSKEYTYLNRLALAIGDIEITDKLSTSAFNKFLFRYESDTCPKHTNSNMIFLKLLCSRSNDMQRLIECDIKLSIQPLRFNIDQDTLLFLIDYFKCLFSKQINFTNINNNNNTSGSSNQVTTSNNTTNNDFNQQQQYQENELIEQQIFIRNFIFSPDLFIRFDFSGKYDKRPDTQLDTLTNILLIMVQLSNTEIKLKRVCYKRGFLGIEKLLACLIKEWVNDIQKNQVKNLIKGWGLFNSIIQLFEGFSCLFWYPIEQYRKDGRVLFGFKKGSAAFSTSTILATIELTNRLFQLTKNIAEFFYDLVTPHQSLSITNGSIKNRNIRNRPHPNDIRQGIENAYFVLYEGLNDTAANLVNEIKTGSELHGLRGAVGGALRQLPSAAVVPFVVAAEASSSILSGIRNQLKPDEKRDDEQKYKSVV